jgi:hypothetical protein
LENTLNPLGALMFGAPPELDFVDELDFEDDELDDDGDELWVAAALLLLPSSFVAKKTTAAMMATAATTMPMIGPVPRPERGAPAGAATEPGAALGTPAGGPGVGIGAPNG